MKKGFTLIELIIVIVVLGILAAYAIPKYININKESELSVAQAFGGSLKSAASIYLSKMAVSGTADPKPDSFNSFVGYSESSSDMNFIHIDNSIRRLLTDPNATVGNGNTITLVFKGGGTAVYTYDPANGRISESFSGF